MFLPRKLKNHFFLTYINLLHVNFKLIKNQFHVFLQTYTLNMTKKGSDQKRGARKVPKRKKKDRLHFTLYRQFKCIDKTQLIRVLEVVSRYGKFSATHYYLGGTIYVFSRTMHKQHPYFPLRFSFLLIFTKNLIKYRIFTTRVNYHSNLFAWV